MKVRAMSRKEIKRTKDIELCEITGCIYRGACKNLRLVDLAQAYKPKIRDLVATQFGIPDDKGGDR